MFDVRCLMFDFQPKDRRTTRRSISKGDIDVARGLDHFAMRRNEAQSVHRVGDRNVAYLIVLVTDHRTEMFFICELDCFYSEPCPENPVESCWRAAALQVS